ncbi:BamA/TamA family outer membrane protein [Tsuneonella flava]|uniref:BamA/TamA family outer membrane protein n=1 Tax=Tsuneonella flava TaxID=2055955 RepID=A0ABX7K9S8_9SPHN|nr:BamA/TamA family outer membrane protein [Tsuneonella flava]
MPVPAPRKTPRSRKWASHSSLLTIIAAALAAVAAPQGAVAQDAAANTADPATDQDAAATGAVEPTVQLPGDPATDNPATDNPARPRRTPRTLQDLIPDSAVDDPEAWAQQGAPQEARADADAIAGESLAADSPLDDAPQIAIPWPDELDLPQLAPLEPDDTIQFADLDEDMQAPTLENGDVRSVAGNLKLAFPKDEAAFPKRGEFTDRFRSLSTIAELNKDGDNLAQLAARAKSDEELLATLLRVYGYYDAQIIRTVEDNSGDSPTADGKAQVRFDIIPGQHYRFGAIDMGDLATAPDAETLRKAFEIQTGDPMSSDKIVEEQADLDTALGETGYPFAAINAPSLLIDHDRVEGDLTMPVRPNGKFVFGEVVSKMPDFLSSRHLEKIARFDRGDVYQRSLSTDLRRAIVATGLVSTVTITPRAVTQPEGDAPGTVAMDVEMTPAKLRTIAGSIGYGTGEGVRVEASWEHRNLFPPEGMLRVRGIAGTREQLLGVTFRKNNFNGRDKVLTVDAYGSTIDTDAYDANTLSLIGSLEKTSTLLFQKPFSWSIGMALVATKERLKIPELGLVIPLDTYFIAAIPGMVEFDTSDDLLNPTKGFRIAGQLSPEVSSRNGVQSFYVRSQVDAAIYKSVGSRVILAARGRVGSIPGAPLDEIAPSRRFYAGGGGSVRGYGYDAIGPRDEFGANTGGRSLVEASFEARIKTGFFGGALQVVPFVDAGSVSQSVTPTLEDIRVGAGIGVRYLTGFGPLRFDVATPLNPEPGDGPVAVYVSLGQAF